MRNRSYLALPSFYVHAEPSHLDECAAEAGPLEVFDITYLHFHSVLELGVCISGRGTCVVEGENMPFSAGDVQIIFPFQRHLSRSEGGEYSRWIWTSLNPLQQLSGWGAPELPRLEKLLYTRMSLCGILRPGERPLLAELIRSVTLPGDARRRTACLCALIEELAAASEGMKPLTLRPERSFLQLEPALKLVQETLEQGRAPRVEALSEACTMSPATFRRAFHASMGQSPRQYVRLCQMKKAQRMLLLTDASVTEVAQSVGYEDVSGFNRQFLQTYGVAPRAYRRTGGQSEKRADLS